MTAVKGQENSEQHRDGERWPNPGGANARSVWSISTEPTPFAHFATWPQALVRRMIQAGTSERGCCPECGAPWGRQIERSDPPEHATPGHTPSFQTRRFASATPGYTTTTTTTGWSPSCECVNGDPESVVAFYPPVPCVVLDPFAGSGTTLKVARDHGRHAVGIELNEDYCRIAAGRLAQQSLLTGKT